MFGSFPLFGCMGIIANFLRSFLGDTQARNAADFLDANSKNFPGSLSSRFSLRFSGYEILS